MARMAEAPRAPRPTEPTMALFLGNSGDAAGLSAPFCPTPAALAVDDRTPRFACCLEFDPAGSALAAGCCDGVVFVWDTDSWEL